MNNLLKIFLIINLFSSVPANNFSQPLPETELKIGQNNSEVVKRDEPITLVGGTPVVGISFGSGGQATAQRYCTLSFPVIKYGKYKGFLTSRACANGDIFVGDTKVGEVQAPGAFIPEKGLDYTFVDVYPEYWSEEISQKITSSRCDSAGGDMKIPLLPTPNQPIHPGFTVYVYGGADGLVKGVILEFDVEIEALNPQNQPVTFKSVTKILMEKPYGFGYLGAPVYIPIRVPDSKQTVASPVGQVVEKSRISSEANVWYYIPLDRILKDGELKIAVGDLSYLLPSEPNTESGNEEFNDNSLSDDLTKESNASEINNLVRRQPPAHQTVYTHAGLGIWASSSSGKRPPPIHEPKRFTLGFAVRKVKGGHQFEHGFLTLGDCVFSYLRMTSTNVFYTPTQNWIRGQAVRLGSVGALRYDPANGLNHATVNLLPKNNERTFWDDDISADMPVMWGDEERLVDVYNRPRIPNERDEVCWWGTSSGHICGTVIDNRATLTRMNPWRWPIYVRVVIPLVIAGHPIPLEFQWSPEDNFEGLIKVRLDEPRQPHAEEDERKHDRGSPVYYPYLNRVGLIIHTQPVGILLDYERVEENRDDRCEVVWYMYCVSVDKILRDSVYRGQTLELIGENLA